MNSVFQDLATKQSTQQSETIQQNIVVNIPDVANLKNVEIDPKALELMQKMVTSSKTKKRKDGDQEVRFVLKNKSNEQETVSDEEELDGMDVGEETGKSQHTNSKKSFF